MVLTSTPHARALALVALALTLGCIGARPPERLATATPIAVHVWLDGPESSAMTPPAAFVERLDAALRERNLVPVHAPSPLTSARDLVTTDRRLAAVLAAIPEPAHALLVEARVTFFSQISGRYRWDVDVRSTLAARASPADPATSRSDTIGVAAFLQYAHEGSPEALDFVARQVVSAIASLVDRHFEEPPAP